MAASRQGSAAILFDQRANFVAVFLTEVVRERRPNVLRAKLAKETDNRYLRYERIALPLSADGETVNMILCGHHVERAF